LFLKEDKGKEKKALLEAKAIACFSGRLDDQGAFRAEHHTSPVLFGSEHIATSIVDFAYIQ